MALQKGFTDELKNVAALPVIGSAASAFLDVSLSRIDSSFDFPCRMYATATPDAKLNFAASTVLAGDSGGRIVPPVDGSAPDRAVSSINFQTGALVGNFILTGGGAFALPSTTVGHYRRVTFSLRSDGYIEVNFSASNATFGSLSTYATLMTTMTGLPLGYADLEATAATAFKTAGSSGNIIENNVGGTARIFRLGSGTGTGSGGGGGSSITWNPTSGSAPVEAEENGDMVFLFEKDLTQVLTAWIKVPQTYITGRQISLYGSFYSPSSSNTFTVQTTAYLVRKDTDAVSSTTNSSTSSQPFTNTVASAYRQATFSITDATGKINSVAVSAGDMIRVLLSRTAGTDTADTRFVPRATEVKFT